MNNTVIAYLAGILFTAFTVVVLSLPTESTTSTTGLLSFTALVLAFCLGSVVGFGFGKLSK